MNVLCEGKGKGKDICLVILVTGEVSVMCLASG